MMRCFNHWKCCEVASKIYVVDTIYGDAFLYYCDKCYEERLKIENTEREEERAKQREEEQLETQKQARYEYLKREVELAELELRAKELGIE